MKVLLVQDQNTPSTEANSQYDTYYDNSYYVDPQAYANVSPDEMGYDQVEMNMVNYGEQSYEEQLWLTDGVENTDNLQSDINEKLSFNCNFVPIRKIQQVLCSSLCC